MTLLGDEAGAQQLLGLGIWEGEVEVRAEYDKQNTRGDETTTSESRRNRYEERLGLRNRGAFIFDPRLSTNNVGVTFGLVQEQERFDDQHASRSGRLLGYSFDSVLLQDLPYSTSLFANRFENIISREFGGRSDLTFENRGGSFRLREDSILQDLGFLHFTSVLGARQEQTKEETTILGETLKRDETRTIASYEGNKGFETSDLTLRYEFADVVEKENPVGTFQSHGANLGYSLDFGPTLNRRWDSRFYYFSRTGAAPNTLFSADEDLRIDHSADLFTDYRYLFSRNEVESGVTSRHTGIVLLQHRLYKSLTTGLRGDGAIESIPDGERTRYGGQLDLDYTRGVPWNGRAFAGTGVRYQIDDNQLRSSRIDVVDEAHTAPIPLGGSAGFTLANRFVIQSTIVVVDTRGGARLPTTPGVDYIVVQEGDFTKIIPLATSPVILAGDPLAVSYAFEVAPSLRFSTVSWRGLVGADFRWVALSFSHEQSEQALLYGRDGEFLEDRRLETLRLDLRGDWELLRTQGAFQYQVQDSTRLKFTRYLFTQVLSWRVVDALTVGLSAEESFTAFTLPARRSDSYSTRGTLDWLPTTSVSVTAFYGFRQLVDSQLPTETIREAGLRARWTIGKLEVAPIFTWTDRVRGSVDTTDLRAEVRVIRRF